MVGLPSRWLPVRGVVIVAVVRHCTVSSVEASNDIVLRYNQVYRDIYTRDKPTVFPQHIALSGVRDEVR